MFCDKCKKKGSYWDMVDIKWNDSNRHWFNGSGLRPMKALLCKECYNGKIENEIQSSNTKE